MHEFPQNALTSTNAHLAKGRLTGSYPETGLEAVERISNGKSEWRLESRDLSSSEDRRRNARF